MVDYKSLVRKLISNSMHPDCFHFQIFRQPHLILTGVTSLVDIFQISLWSHNMLYTSHRHPQRPETRLWNCWTSPLRTWVRKTTDAITVKAWLQSVWCNMCSIFCSECSKNQKTSHAYWSLCSWTLGGCLHLPENREQLIREPAILFFWGKRHFTKVVGVYPASV